eukprot:CAMPEP_0202903356 /NCGR_PEP_ID=MMETSP1392-20130828/23997_1 /ASSEMBLY_ACC=CAM_ASM_000868 /TAXON_ID=225041 /ORGANISM="Chlamydomonas chlamydogama, Strain SAG 11-48b" /LENGTH=198 /DNA_ID=CAMNT_0049590491 /DNA_START=92 /DNA_END=689 /DNA_ORIENTATION=+
MQVNSGPRSSIFATRPRPLSASRRIGGAQLYVTSTSIRIPAASASIPAGPPLNGEGSGGGDKLNRTAPPGTGGSGGSGGVSGFFNGSFAALIAAVSFAYSLRMSGSMEESATSLSGSMERAAGNLGGSMERAAGILGGSMERAASKHGWLLVLGSTCMGGLLVLCTCLQKAKGNIVQHMHESTVLGPGAAAVVAEVEA